MEKIKMLCLFDYACSTGFATVSSNIMRELAGTGQFDVHILAINATGDPYDHERFPFTVFPAVTIETMHHNPNMDVYGRDKFLSMLANGDYDLVFIIQDTFIVQTFAAKMFKIIEELEKRPKTILYYPIDAMPELSWIEDTVCNFDYPVPYTNFARNETLKLAPNLEKLREPIYHGTNPTEFFYEPDRESVKLFRHNWFNNGLCDDRYILLNVNRNQPRKDIFRSLQVIKCLRELGDTDTILYLHMQYSDAGGDLLLQARQIGLEIGEDFILPTPRVFNSNQGVDVPTLNMIYNAADCVVTTTHGEGWGLSITEGFATRTPVIAPNNTSLTEMLADNRGKLVDCGDTWQAWAVRDYSGNDNSRIRPVVNVEKFAKAVLEVKSGKALPDIDKAQKWAYKYSWEHVCKDWLQLFQEAATASKTDNQRRLMKAEFKKGRSKKARRKAKAR